MTKMKKLLAVVVLVCVPRDFAVCGAFGVC